MRQALDNLEDLIEEGRGLLGARKLPNTASNRRAFDLLNESLQNLEAKFAAGAIKSVPDLNDATQKKYRHGTERGSPTGAYCDDETFIRNGSGEDACTPGDILLDDSILDPGGGTAINESTMAGWQQKWALLHILVHEKFHEIMLQAQLAELEKLRSWQFKTPAQREQLREVAERRAASPESHAEVYTWQKNVLRLYKKVLEEERKELRTDRRANADAIRDIDARIQWLKDELRRLESAKRKAVRGYDFGFDGCGWPQNQTSGTAALYVTFPGGYWVLGATLEGSQAADFQILETAFLDSVEVEDTLAQPPALYALLSETTFSGMQIQPDPCEYIDWAVETGGIATFTDPARLRDLLPSPLTVSVVDGLTGAPLEGVTVDLFDSTGSHVQRVVTNETGAFATLLPPDAYRLQVGLRILGFHTTVRAVEIIDSRTIDEVRVEVSAVIMPVTYLPFFVQLLLASILAAIAGVLAYRLGGGRLPRWGPYALGAAVGGAALLPFFLG